MTIRALVVDDSALMRKLMFEILNSDPDIEVVGTAEDPYVAREKIRELNPDVLTLDIEMPKMDGITFLSNLMRLRPMPVVMVSSLTQRGADLTIRALELGAVDFVSKPKIDLESSLEKCGQEIIEKVKNAANSSVGSITALKSLSQKVKPIQRRRPTIDYRTTHQVIAIGASTGGTEAIKNILVSMPPDSPGVVIALHIPSVFSRSFAKRMNKLSRLSVCEAEDGQQILPGHVFVAPGDKHLKVERDGACYRCRLNEEDPVNKHRPAVDVLFNSVAKNTGKNAVGVILTGMGKDGAAGLKNMLDSGARTIAQDEKSCVVWGMPKAAVNLGGVGLELPLSDIAEKIEEYVRH